MMVPLNEPHPPMASAPPPSPSPSPSLLPYRGGEEPLPAIAPWTWTAAYVFGLIICPFALGLAFAAIVSVFERSPGQVVFPFSALLVAVLYGLVTGVALVVAVMGKNTLWRPVALGILSASVLASGTIVLRAM